ncbi:MAG: D-aminoacyl-tRNA deacylase [Bacillota bacterium]|jgi:D-tyrosyl-tRNA(Tyr) deacylase
MKAVLQRVIRGSVQVADKTVSAIDQGVVILLGVAAGDTAEDAAYLAKKTATLRIFEDESEKMNLSLLDVKGEALVVSQFTLSADCRRGTRPSFSKAAPAAEAESLYEEYVRCLRKEQVVVKTGVFQTMMQVNIVNDGPVTIILESK